MKSFVPRKSSMSASLLRRGWDATQEDSKVDAWSSFWWKAAPPGPTKRTVASETDTILEKYKTAPAVTSNLKSTPNSSRSKDVVSVSSSSLCSSPFETDLDEALFPSIEFPSSDEEDEVNPETKEEEASVEDDEDSDTEDGPTWRPTKRFRPTLKRVQVAYNDLTADTIGPLLHENCPTYPMLSSVPF